MSGRSNCLWWWWWWACGGYWRSFFFLWTIANTRRASGLIGGISSRHIIECTLRLEKCKVYLNDNTPNQPCGGDDARRIAVGGSREPEKTKGKRAFLGHQLLSRTTLWHKGLSQVQGDGKSCAFDGRLGGGITHHLNYMSITHKPYFRPPKKYVYGATHRIWMQQKKNTSRDT